MKDFDPDPIAIGLLRKFLSGQTSEAESSLVIQWLEENYLSREDIQYVLENPEAVWVFDKINAPQSWSVVKKKMVQRPKVVPMRTFLRAAASILIIVALAGIGWKVNEHLSRPLVVSNTSGQVLNFMLPDSSKVSLNSHSSLTYFNSFSRKRSIRFEGEALFEIKRDVTKPFIVKTAGSEIKVLGTSFCVSTESRNTRVIVASGKVAFYSTLQLNDTLYLEKGDKGVFNSQAGSLEKERNKDLNFLAWKNHRLVFEKTPMDRVIGDLEKFFNVKVEVKNPEIYKLNYTSEFTNPTLPEVLNEMELVLNIKSEITGSHLLMNLK